jgi:hypothetical protein
LQGPEQRGNAGLLLKNQGKSVLLVKALKHRTHNPSYSGGRDRRIMVQGQPGQKLIDPHLKKKKIWCMSVIPATGWDVEVGGPWFETSLGKFSVRYQLKNKLKAKGLRAWLKL